MLITKIKINFTTMKNPIADIITISYPKSLIHREGQPQAEEIHTEELKEEINKMLDKLWQLEIEYTQAAFDAGYLKHELLK